MVPNFTKPTYTKIWENTRRNVKTIETIQQTQPYINEKSNRYIPFRPFEPSKSTWISGIGNWKVSHDHRIAEAVHL